MPDKKVSRTYLLQTEKKKDDLEEVHNKYTEEKDGLTESLDGK